MTAKCSPARLGRLAARLAVAAAALAPEVPFHGPPYPARKITPKAIPETANVFGAE
jgi:hypothetical protein